MKNPILGGMMGLVVGDALGVPVEFLSREEMTRDPVVGMRAYGSHEQPRGSWSDDSSMALCLAESLINGLDYKDIYSKFIAWAEDGYMTPHGNMFDIGRTTLTALRNYEMGMEPLACGGDSELDNGNGSLMRILPAAFYTMGMKECERFEVIHNISRLTHGHMRSLVACGIYSQIVIELMGGYDKEKACGRAMGVCSVARRLAAFERKRRPFGGLLFECS